MPVRGNLKADQLNGYPNSDTLFLAGQVDTDGSNKWLAPTGGGGGGSATGMGTVFTPPPTSGWTNRNFSGGTSVTYSAVSAYLHIEDASLNWRLITRPVSGDFDLVCFIRSIQFQISSQTAGIYLFDGTKLMGIEFLTQGSVFYCRVEKINSYTSDNSSVGSIIGGNISLTCPPWAGGSWLRIERLSGVLTFYMGLDGATWETVFSEAVGTFITPTDVGVGGVSVTGGGGRFVGVSLLSWTGV